MSNDNDLIRRGDAIAILSAASRTAQKTIDAIAAIPAAQSGYEGRILAALEWKTTVSPEVQALVDDGRPCVSDLFLVALFDQINDIHDREYFIKAWLEGDWECATSEITIGAAK